ncbi:MAG: hypothetical protein WA510_05235, partial [Acidobacteriaceae bacterium]
MTLRIFATLLCFVLALSTSAQTQPEVAFLGDTLTYQWQQSPQFQANKNWVGYGQNFPVSPLPARGTAAALSQLQNIIASGQKPIVHLLVGQADADGLSDSYPGAIEFGLFATNFDKIIATAQAAKLKIIVGTVPWASYGNLTPFNDWIFQYCNAHSVPVINYDFALNGGKGFAANKAPILPPPVYYTPGTAPGSPPPSPLDFN